MNRLFLGRPGREPTRGLKKKPSPVGQTWGSVMMRPSKMAVSMQQKTIGTRIIAPSSGMAPGRGDNKGSEGEGYEMDAHRVLRRTPNEWW